MPDRGGTIGREASPSLNRATQVLPIPLGGLAPAHRRPSGWGRAWRRHQAAALLGLASVAAGSGIWLSSHPPSFSAGEDARGIHVGDITLAPIKSRLFNDVLAFAGVASMAVRTLDAGTVHAGAVMTWNGRPSTGRCVLLSITSAARETCNFQIGSTRLTATDWFDIKARTWHRRYDDGMAIAISVPTGLTVVPIPFPLGR